MELASLVRMNPQGGSQGAVGRILAQMPDPMRPALGEVLFVIALVTLLYLALRVIFFRPIVEHMENRERDLNAGNDTKAKAAALVEARQKDYQDRLKELRAKAFAHRKSLAEAATKQKQGLLEEARAKAQIQRQGALETLRAESAKAKQDLVAQVDILADSMVQHLLKQA